MFAEVTRRVPAFAGAYVDDNNNDIMYVGLLDPARKAEAVRALAEVFGPERSSPREVRAVEAQFSFLVLKSWYEKLAPAVLALPGVALTDIDEKRNRLVVGIENENVQTRRLIEEQINNFGIPHQAVIVEVTGPNLPASHTLRSYVRPLEGGLQIENVVSRCTEGFNATRSGVLGIVTNSHCTAAQGGVESTVFHQPTTASDRIGVETVDPNYWTGGGCPSGRECRYSDSAFVKLDSSVTANLGYIARPTGLGSTTIDHSNPRFRIVSEDLTPVVGELVNKVGRSTGWSRGNIVATCVTINASNTNKTFLCQDSVSATVAAGDSGSPVFRIVDSPLPGDVYLYGLLWGGNNGTTFHFSRITSVQRSDELGTLNTCATGGC